jgi:hypothetical protein
MYLLPVLAQVGALQAEVSQTKEEAFLALDSDLLFLVEPPRATQTEPQSGLVADTIQPPVLVQERQVVPEVEPLKG